MQDFQDTEYWPQTVEANDEEYVKQLFEKAHRFYRIRNYGEAIEYFKEIEKIKPDSPEILVNIGNCLYNSRVRSEAISYWQKAIKLDSTLFTPYFNIANYYYSEERVDDAIVHWLIALTIKPEHSSVLLNLGIAYEKKGNKVEAFKYYETFLKHSDTKTSLDYKRINNRIQRYKYVAMHNLKVGIFYQRKQKLRQAAQAYMKAIEEYPIFAKAHLNMGSICYLSENYEKAVEYWMNSLRIDDGYKNTYCNLAVAYDKIKKYSYAYCFYKKYLDFIPENHAEYASLKERLDTIKEYIQKHPEIVQEHYNAATKFLNAKEFRYALEEFENYKMLAPGEAVKVEGKIAELKDYLNPLKKNVTMAMGIGEKFMNKGEFDNAMKAFQKCVALDPKSEEAKKATQKINECAKMISSVVKAISR